MKSVLESVLNAMLAVCTQITKQMLNFIFQIKFFL